MAKNKRNAPKTLRIPWAIRAGGQFLSAISSKWATLYAARLFTTPLRYPLPKRELQMDAESRQETIRVKKLGKDIVVYHYGGPGPKVLLVHGWAGRGTQLVKIADALIKEGYAVVSFDAPAHGKSPGKRTLMPEFIAAIHEIDAQFGPFEAAIGHSLGGMSVLNALGEGFAVQRAVTIGAGDIIKDIFDEFVRKMEMQPEISDKMKAYFEKRSDATMDSYSSYLAASRTDVRVFVIHDTEDEDVPVHCAHHIYEHLQNRKLLITGGLGHRKILGDASVIAKIVGFLRGD